MTTQTLSTPQPVTADKNRLLLILIGVAVLIVVTYALAWGTAYNLTRIYLNDANTSFENGEYLEALTGYSSFDEALGRNVFHGGYSQIANIWADQYAWPMPNEAAVSRARIEEIIDQRLTVDDAERFVQRNIGRSNPYLGRIFLRMGELYQEQGDLDTAQEIFEEAVDLFNNEPALQAQAQSRLDQLQQAEGGS